MQNSGSGQVKKNYTQYNKENVEMMASSSNANNSGTSRSAGNSNVHPSQHYSKMSQQFSQS
jgi:hypothetical protein